MNPSAHAGGLRRSTTLSTAAGRRTDGREPLSPRELDVVGGLARGRTNAEIATELFVSLSTVKTHVSNVQARLCARNRVEIAVWEHGQVS